MSYAEIIRHWNHNSEINMSRSRIKLRCDVPSQNNPNKVSAITSISLYGIVGTLVCLFVLIKFEFLFEHGERKGSSAISLVFVLSQLEFEFGHKFSRYRKNADGVVCGTIWKLIFNRNLLSKSINCSFLKCGKFDFEKETN